MIYNKTKLLITKLRFMDKNFGFVTKYKRKIFNTRGYRVHSPYVYDFIHRVIKNKRPYYCFDTIWEEIKHGIENNEKQNNITKKTTFELIFRIIDSLSLKNVSIVTDNIEDNLLYRYIRNINCNVSLYKTNDLDNSLYDSDMIVVETFEGKVIDCVLNDKTNKKNIVVIITEKTFVKSKIKEKLSTTCFRTPSAIELNNMEIWFLGYVVSNKKTKLYYK